MKITTKIFFTPNELKEILRNHLLKTGTIISPDSITIEALCTQNGMTLHHRNGFNGIAVNTVIEK